MKPDVCGKQSSHRWVDDDYYQDDDRNQFGGGVGMVTSKEELHLLLLLQTTIFGAGNAHGTLKGKIGSLGGSEETTTMSDATVCWGLLGSVF